MRTKEAPLYIWGDFDMPFLLLVLALLGFGLVMLFSASYARAYYYQGSSFYYIGRQIRWSIIGVAGMIAASFVNYHWLRKFVWPLYAASLGLCMLCYLFEAEGGARRWVSIGPVNFQPSEIGKFALILLFAHLMSKDQDKMNNLWMGTLRYLALFGALAVVVVFQPHLSATILLAGITVAMLFVGGAKIQHLIGVGVTGLAGIAAMVFTMWSFFSDRFAHVLVRLTYWLDPFSTSDAGAYQTKQSLMAIGSGGLLGVGLGESRQKQLYLPEVQNDFIFAVVCEELGFVGATLIIILFAPADLARLHHRSARKGPLRHADCGGHHYPDRHAGDAEHRRCHQHHPQHRHQPADVFLRRHLAVYDFGRAGDSAGGVAAGQL